MTISSINTNLAALLAQTNISNANTNVANDVAALSSGNRLVQASTDVAALAAGTALQSQVNTLNTSLTVASQGSSLLQVADGALAQIGSILQRQQAITTQAQSGSLSSTQLGFLDQEFQNLTSEINQLAGSTNFNGVNLLDGSLSQSLSTTIGNTASTAASGSYTVTTNAANNDTLTVNGQALTFKTTATAGDVTVGGTIGSTVANLVSFINGAASNTNLTAAQQAAFSAVQASQVGSSGTITLTARNGGTLGSTITLGAASGTLAVQANGQYTGTTSSISGIAVGSTSTALTSAANTGGFLNGGTITFGGAAVAGSTISATTTLASLVANINSNSSTSGVSAFVTGISGAYTLNLASTTTGATNIAAASTALALSQTTALATTNGAATIGALTTPGSAAQQIITFHGLTSATEALTEGNSSLANGALKFTSASTPTETTLATVALGTTTLTSLAAAITASNGGNTYTATVAQVGNDFTLTVQQLTAGTALGFDTNAFASSALSNYAARSADTNYTVAGSATTQAVAALTGGQNNGIGYNSTVGVGTSLDNILVGQNQTQSAVTITYPNIANSDVDSTSNFGASTPASITVAGVAFQFTTTASTSNTEIQIGSSLQQTLANAVAKINSFQGTGAQNYQFNQIQASANGNSITISTKNVGSATDLSGSTVTVAASGSSSSVAGTLANGSTSGINTTGVDNAAFVGNIVGGFSATYSGTANTVNLALTVGGVTYAASNVSTSPTANTTINLVSTAPNGAGGSLSIQMQALDGGTVNSQSDANNIASRLNTAISGLTFYQSRAVTSYNPAASGSSIIADGAPTGSLNGSSINVTASDFTNFSISNIQVSAPQGSSTNGSLTFTADGQQYASSASLGSTLNANTSYTLTSTTNPNSTITFKTGSTSIDFSNSDKAAALQTALSQAFGSGSGSALTFQVGSTSADTIGVSIGSAQSSALFGGKSLDVTSQADAVTAAAVIQSAINTVTSLRATVGALEERFNYASSAIQSASQNEGAAQSALLDTDVAGQSSKFATAQVQLQAGIAVLAQSNQLQQNLLKLIQ